MLLGWDDYVYIYKIRDGRIAVAKYSRAGEQLWNKVIELNETGDKIGADGKGNIFIIGLDEYKKSVMLRLSPDGTTVDAVLKDITDGGTLRYDGGDMVLVSREGVIYTVNSAEALRSFNSDFSVKYISTMCKEDDESAMEDYKSEK